MRLQPTALITEPRNSPTSWDRPFPRGTLRHRLACILPINLFTSRIRARTIFRCSPSIPLLDRCMKCCLEPLPDSPRLPSPWTAEAIFFLRSIKFPAAFRFIPSIPETELLPHPIAFAITPSAKFLYVLNGNLASVFAYTITSGVLQPVSGLPVKVGNGPLALAVDPAETFVY